MAIFRFYHSSLDSLSLLSAHNFQIICDAATVAARTAYMLATGATDPATVPAELVADCAFVNSTIECLLGNFSCPQVTQFINST